MDGHTQEENNYWINHSSHRHALQLIPTNQTLLTTQCSDATTTVINTERPNPVYGCRTCNFHIHKACSELRPYVGHPSHPSHTLTLVHTSPYLQGTTQCDACWKQINDNGCFFYHCTHCNFDLHAHCAFLPSRINHGCHPHPLSLDCSSAYVVSAYDCDLCSKSVAAKAWFYHCNTCDFEAHIDCVLGRRGGSAVGAAPWPMHGSPTAPGRPANPLTDSAPAFGPGQVGAPGVSSGLGSRLDHFAVPTTQGTYGNTFEQFNPVFSNLHNHHQDALQGSDLGNSGNVDALGQINGQQLGNDSQEGELDLEHAKLQYELNIKMANQMAQMMKRIIGGAKLG